MAARLCAPVLLAAFVLSLAGAERAGAAIKLGSPDSSTVPDRYACASACPGRTEVGMRQLALQGSLLEAPEDGVLVAAGAYAKRIGGDAAPLVAVLRPVDGIGADIVATAPLPVSSREGAPAATAGLHLPVEPGDSLAFVFRTGEVDLGVRARPRPDGAVVSFKPPCSPCGEDNGTGVELLFAGTVEPDVDGDLLGDETQDPDLGGALFGDEDFDPLFDDELDEEEFGDDVEPGARRPRRLRLIKATPRRDGGADLLLAVPRAGRVSAAATREVRPDRNGRARAPGAKGEARQTPGAKGNAQASAAARLTIAVGRTRVRRARRVQLELIPSRAGRRLLEQRGPLRARVTVTLWPMKGNLRTLAKPLELGELLPRRSQKRPRAGPG